MIYFPLKLIERARDFTKTKYDRLRVSMILHDFLLKSSILRHIVLIKLTLIKEVSIKFVFDTVVT